MWKLKTYCELEKEKRLVAYIDGGEQKQESSFGGTLSTVREYRPVASMLHY
jgi:hypothetical protein